jgi:acid phosphatase (class A)
MRLAARFFTAALLLSAAPAFADPLLLSAADYAPSLILPAPPADGSLEQKAELAELKRIQKAMSAEAYAKADQDDKTENVTIFIETLGPWFDLKTLPKTAALFTTLRAEEKAAAKAAKNTFLRNRPWVLDASLKSCTREDAPQSSYPSGHATMGYSFAVVLAHLLPDYASAILARAKSYGENRLVCGVHYRADIVAGQVLGSVVAEELFANPSFKSDFEAAKAELAAARPH